MTTDRDVKDTSQDIPISRRKKNKTIVSKETKDRVKKLGKTNLTHDEIAEMVGLDRSTISKMLKRFNVHKEELETFRGEKADAMAVVQREILNNVTVEEIKKAPLQVKMMAFGVLFDKERLERGQSSANIDIRAIAALEAELGDIDKELAALKSKPL